MNYEELLANIASKNYKESRTLETPYIALRAVVELHKPYSEADAPYKISIGWCKGCTIEYDEDAYASQRFPCPTIEAIEKELT
jgi:hypothetical protein